MTHIARTSAVAPLSLAIAWTWLAGAAAAQTPLFEVEKSDATKVLEVTDDAGFVVRGAFDAGVIPVTGAGVRLMWYPKKAAFRVGRVEGAQWDDGSIGQWSVAFGLNTTASGTHSVAMNSQTTASGDRSVAMGASTIASGIGSLAAGLATVASGGGSTTFGQASQASGAHSLATGFRTQATGDVATAMGTGVIAAGAASVAMGSVVTAQGDGSFIFGDRSFTSFPLTAAANTFMVRAFGGIGFNTGVNIGCDLPAGTGAWACTSSRLAKARFEDLDGEAVLAKLATIPIQRWHYLGTESAHVGPTAEDFHSAFGLGEGPTTITTVDADGIALLGVQTLERRTAALQAENAELRVRNAEILHRLEVLESERTRAAR